MLKLLESYMDIEIEVLFLNCPHPEEKFTGTALEVAKEVGVRTLIYGTCAYKILGKAPILLKVED